ncbi:MAG TPA: DUF4175 family protein [Rhodothermales bacterium]
MSEQTLQLLQAIRERLARTVRRISLADALHGLVITIAVAAFAWIVAVAVESQFWLDVGPRTALLVAVLLASLVAFGVLAARPLLRFVGLLPPEPDESVATRIGGHYPEVGDRLRNLLDLSSGRGSEAPPSLLDGAVGMLGRQILPVPFEQVEDFSRARRAARFAAVPLVLLVLFAVAAPSAFLGASHRLVAVGVPFERPAPFTLEVLPGDVELVRGAELEAVVRASGTRLPATVTLAINHDGEEHVERIELLPDSSGRFRHIVQNVRRPLRYRAESGALASRWYDATVLERPVMRGLQVTLRYPSYSGLAPRRLEPNVGDVTALAGTRVSVEVGLGSQQLEDAFLAFDDGTRVPLERAGEDATASFTLRKSGSYHVTLRGYRGIENAEPIVYRLDVVPDEPPSIVLTSPEPVYELDGSLAVPVGSRIRDDFGFTDLALFYRLAESRYKATSDSFAVIEIPLDRNGPLDQHVAFAWQLDESTTIDPVPGDAIEYYVRVRDNDAFAGFKEASSERFRLVVPSLAERYAALDESQDAAEKAIARILEEASTVREQFEELRNELRQNQEGTWDNQRHLEQLQSRQAEVEQRVEELGQHIEEMTQEMRTNDLVSEETVRMYDELRKVVDEINAPELREALKRLQEAVENLDLQSLQQSLGDVEFNEQQYRQRLERTLELFKKMRVHQELDEAARRAEELARMQAEMAERTQELAERGQQREGERPQANEERDPTERENDGSASDERPESDQASEDNPENRPRSGVNEQVQPSAEDLAREQEMARSEAEELLRNLEEARAQMEEMRNASPERMEQMLEESNGREMPQQLQQNAQQLRQQQLQQAQQGQQQMSQSLQQISSMIRQMQQSMSSTSVSLNVSGIRRALEDVLTLSQAQESARLAVQEMTPDSPRLREQAQEQIRLAEGLSVVADSLQRLSREVPQMSRTVQQLTGEALREMSEATTALADRTARVGAAHQQGAMTRLNELALVLADLLNQLMNSSGGGGGQSMQQMLQQMQQMAGQQEQLNQQIQQFLNDLQGNRLASDAQQRLQQLADQQSAIRQQLQEVSRNPEARGRLLGDLNRIAQQMEETIGELRAAQADRRMIERQQQILTRLLEAQKSLRERGREEEREARSAEDILRTSPGALPASEEAERLRQDLLRALEAGYAPEYQELIKRYFELLQQEQTPAEVEE